MAAIIPFLEQQDDPAETPIEREALSLPAEVSEESGTVEDEVGAQAHEDLAGLGRLEPPTVFAVGDLNAEALSKTHSGLVTTAWIRSSVEQALEGNRYSVVTGGQGQRKVFIELEHGVAVPREGQETDERFPVAPWSPAATPTAKRFGVLSWTSKMGAPSFSLPAGPVVMGGSCPGANAGQSIVPPTTLLRAARDVADVIGKPVRLQQAICQYCYAEGGQYATGQVQFAQVVRYVWCRDALRKPSGGLWSPESNEEPPDATYAWIEAMTYAIQNADYLLDGGKSGKIDYPKERHPGRYFRIHDSGDFWGPGYLWMWKQVANALPDITFWAPSRYWAVGPKAIEHVNVINTPGNLVIRPSAFHVNEAPPRDLGPGWASGSTAFAIGEKQEGYAQGDFEWDCQTYAVEDEKHTKLGEEGEHTCRHAKAPDGKIGCRACWRHTDAEVNYTLHLLPLFLGFSGLLASLLGGTLC